MKFKKRGAFEVQFNWIFILIAGAVILLFFGMIITKQKAASEQKMVASFLTDLELIMTGSMVSKEALNFISIPNKEINFEGCDFYYIGKGDARLKRDIKEKIIFAPDMIKGTKLTIWTLPWNIPYRVTNFLYLTSPQIRYIIVYDSGSSGFADEIEKLLPPETITIDEEEFNVMFRDKKRPDEIDDPGEILDLNNYKVKFVILEDIDPTDTNDVKLVDLNRMEAENVRAIKLDGDTESGTIYFYKKQGSKFILDVLSDLNGEAPYLGKASLIGAIFAEDERMYECAMQSAFKRMRVVSDVYYDRTRGLTGCDYTDALNKLANIRDASGTFQQIIIKIKNNQITYQDKNCPLVY